MGNLTDAQWGMAKETTYNTPVTVSRFFPHLEANRFPWLTRRRSGRGLMAGGGRVVRVDRSVTPIGQGELVVTAELASKGFGVLLEAACGVGASTLVAGTTYQHVFHPGITGTVMPSYTIQRAIPRNDGTIDVETFAGCTAKSASIDCPEDDIMTVSVTFDARSYTTATALAVATYASGATLFDHSQGAASVGGALTVPTSTALGSVATSFGHFRSWRLAWDHSADDGRWVLGSRNIPTVSRLVPTLGGTVEYNDTQLRTAYLASTALPAAFTHTTTEALSTGTATFQAVIPAFYLTNPVPEGVGGETVTADITGEVQGDLVGSRPFYLVLRTADAAL